MMGIRGYLALRQHLHGCGLSVFTGFIACGAFIMSLASPAWAGEPPPPALYDLAKRFAAQVGEGLATAEEGLSGKSAQQIALEKNFKNINDGEMMILIVLLREASNYRGSQHGLQDPITAIKQGKSAFLSFSDFNFVAGYPIKIDVDKGTADGWYMQEDQPFRLDINNNTVQLGDRTETFAPEDIIVEPDGFYIRSAVLDQWFNLQSLVDVQGQRIELITNQPFPTQERINRLRRRGQAVTRSVPEQPRVNIEPEQFTTPRADVSLTQEYQKPGNNSTAEDRLSSRYSVLTSNQNFGYETSGFFSGTLASNTDSEVLDQVRLNFRKESENNDLLGPLKAKIYEFNDLTPVYISGTGSSSIERGFRVSNQGQRFSVDTSTVIDGDAQPGWDVELYRNSAFLGGQTVGEDGRFSFDNVQLFSGDNRFRIVYFGEQGEEREEERIITVLPNLVGDIKGFYNLSLTQRDEITYRSGDYGSEDKGTPRLVGLYSRRAGDNLTLRGGLHSRETQGQRDNYFYSGAVTNLGETLINADLVTTSDGPFEAIVTGRRRFGRHNATASAEYASENFSELFVDETKLLLPAEQRLRTSITGPFFSTTFKNVVYDATAGLIQSDNGSTRFNSAGSLSSSFMGLRFNNAVKFSQRDQANSLSTDNDTVASYEGTVSGRFQGYNWRSGINYDITPESEPERAYFSLNKKYSAKINANFDAQQLFDPAITELSTGFTYLGENARYSPSLTYDTEQNLTARVSVNFGLYQDPYSGKISTDGTAVSNYAGLSVFTYLDKNGNGLFDGDDEALPDVVVNAKQMNLQLVTDETGVAFNGTVPTYRPTDIVMEESSSFEPSWVSGFAGVSVILRPSETTRVEFPVLRGAEIDGTATLASSTGIPSTARSMTINLTTPDGETVKSTTTPFDGFYVIERIRPGVYYMTTDSSQSPTTAYRLPEKIIVTTEGGQFYGKNIELTRGYDIPFTFSAANANPSLQRRTKILKPEDIAREDVYIRLGNYRSGVALALDWYKFKLRTRSWQNSLSPVVADFDTIARDANTSLLPLRLQPTQPLRLSEAALLCERLVDAGFEDCGVDVVTTYQGDAPEAAAASSTPSKG